MNRKKKESKERLNKKLRKRWELRKKFLKKQKAPFPFLKKSPSALMKLEEMEKIINSFDTPDPELLNDLPKIREIIR